MRQAPRFGHTSDFSALLSSTEESEDYLRGLVFAGAFILAIGIAWYVKTGVLCCQHEVTFVFLCSGCKLADALRKCRVYMACLAAIRRLPLTAADSFSFFLTNLSSIRTHYFTCYHLNTIGSLLSWC